MRFLLISFSHSILIELFSLVKCANHVRMKCKNRVRIDHEFVTTHYVWLIHTADNVFSVNREAQTILIFLSTFENMVHEIVRIKNMECIAPLFSLM